MTALHRFAAQKQYAINMTRRLTWWCFYGPDTDLVFAWTQYRVLEAGATHRACHAARAICKTCRHYLPAELSARELKLYRINSCCHPSNFDRGTFAVQPAGCCGRHQFNLEVKP